MLMDHGWLGAVLPGGAGALKLAYLRQRNHVYTTMRDVYLCFVNAMTSRCSLVIRTCLIRLKLYAKSKQNG